VAHPRHLSSAPIIEAIVDLRAALSPTFNPESFAAARPHLATEYPIMEERRAFSKVRGSHASHTLHEDTSARLQGVAFRSADSLTVAQFLVSGLILNRLAPYTEWKQIRAEALRLWTLYVTIAKPEAVTRAALRYINRMRVPATGRLGDYLEVIPPLFPGAPEKYGRFLLRATYSDSARGRSASIVEGLEFPQDRSHGLIIFDIDTSAKKDLELAPEPLGSVLDELRTMKNDIFFGTLTDQFVATFE
jgi:uncharacterized protein (TIGR04255 family)